MDPYNKQFRDQLFEDQMTFANKLQQTHRQKEELLRQSHRNQLLTARDLTGKITSDLRSEIQTCNLQKEEFFKKLKDCERQMAARFEDQISALKSEIEKVRMDNGLLQNENDVLRKRCTDEQKKLQSNYQKLFNECQTNEQKMEELELNLKQCQSSSSNNSLKRFEKQCQKLQERNLRQIEELQKRIESMQHEMGTRDLQNQRTIQSLKSQYREQAIDKDYFESQLENLDFGDELDDDTFFDIPTEAELKVQRVVYTPKRRL